MSRERRAVVVGAGIGGLATAIGLRLAGFRVTVLERAAELAEVGSGITLWPNALRGLDVLGLGQRTWPLTEQRGGGIRDPRGQWLAQWNGDEFQRVLGGPLLALHRAQLIDILREALPDKVVRTGVTVSDVDTGGTVRWKGGEISADLVVGADGIRSRVRNQLWPEHPGPAYGRTTAFRAVVDGETGLAPSTTLGSGTEFGVVPLVDRRLYWYAALKAPAGVQLDPKPFLRRRFHSWHAEAREIIERTSADRVLHNDLYQLDTPLPRYNTGRVALVGDAAHAMPPFLGQGGCQAIEDAVELTAVVGSGDDLPAALARYDARRRPRSQAIARQSVRMGRMGAQLSHPLAVAGRNAITRIVPSGLSIRMIAAATDWNPPDIVPDRS